MFLNLITFNNASERKVKFATKDVQTNKFYYSFYISKVDKIDEDKME
jgi:hypothetical protein